MTMVLGPGQSFESLVAVGNRSCPACSGGLRRWGHARWRVVRGPAGEWGHRPARVRCAGCGATQVVLPPEVLVRRRDAAAVIGGAWRAFARGVSARRVAEALGVPSETVRGWRRRLVALTSRSRTGPSRAASDVERLAAALARLEAEAGVAGWTGDDVWRFAAHRSQGALLLANTS